jgi:ketosteroid isomerase-like protein
MGTGPKGEQMEGEGDGHIAAFNVVRASRARGHGRRAGSRRYPRRHRMSASDLAQLIEQYHQGLDAFVKGDPEPVLRLCSRRDDVTLANPLGPPARGWDQVEKAAQGASSQSREGAFIGFETISEYATSDLAYNFEIERAQAKLGGADEMSQVSLRVTTVFRREDDGWRIVHRHADPITSPRPIDSIVEQ